jgi:hypothetical protein
MYLHQFNYEFHTHTYTNRNIFIGRACICNLVTIDIKVHIDRYEMKLITLNTLKLVT